MKLYPERHGIKWDDFEDEILTNAFNSGKKPIQLAQAHMRTVGAITSRLCRLVLIYSYKPKRCFLRTEDDRHYCNWFGGDVEEQPKKKRKKKKNRQ